eukprot:9314238-Ditylum_brightwellii.AAC.1
MKFVLAAIFSFFTAAVATEKGIRGVCGLRNGHLFVDSCLHDPTCQTNICENIEGLCRGGSCTQLTAKPWFECSTSTNLKDLEALSCPSDHDFPSDTDCIIKANGKST